MDDIGYLRHDLNVVVLERVFPQSQWHEVARFGSVVTASNYCLWRRSTASNIEFETMFFVEPTAVAA